MRPILRKLAICLLPSLLVIFSAPQLGATETFVRKEDVIYGRKDGLAMTLDVFTPDKPNGLGIIQVINGGYTSSHDAIHPEGFKALLRRGYVVFAVVTSSQPRYHAPEMVKDVKRALRFVRFKANSYGIDPARIGITGGSAGGNISLLIATTADDGDADAKDSVERESSRVQAAAVFFPITDWLNIGKPGVEYVIPADHPRGLGGGFGYLQLNPVDGSYERITDRAKLREIAKSISPIYSISKDCPPMLLWHGDGDKLVPIQQSESFVAKAKETGLDVKLLIKSGAGHGWMDMSRDMEQFADWFDEKLKKRIK